MFFKNLIAFKLTELFDQTSEQLSDKLWDSAFLPCGLHSESSIGFVPPVSQVFTGEDSMVHAANSYMMFCIKTQKKVLPSSAVNEVFNEKKALLETEQNRKLSAKERRELKDNIVFELLPKALTTSKLTYAYIDVKGGFVVIDTSSSGAAEDVLSLLRKCLGSLACVPLNPLLNPSMIMTEWLAQRQSSSPDLMSFDGDAVLKSVDEEKSVIRCKNQDLFCYEIQNHLSAGKLVTAISLTYDNRLSFTLDDTLAVKKLKFLDAHYDGMYDNAETPEQRFDADFAIMTGELTAFIGAMIGWFGGLVEGV